MALQKAPTIMGAAKCVASLGLKVLDCIASWDKSTALEYDSDALWEHFLPCLFGSS